MEISFWRAEHSDMRWLRDAIVGNLGQIAFENLTRVLICIFGTRILLKIRWGKAAIRQTLQQVLRLYASTWLSFCMHTLKISHVPSCLQDQRPPRQVVASQGYIFENCGFA